MVERPEGEPVRVVVDVQEDEVVALDVVVALSLLRHHVGGVPDVLARVVAPPQLLDARLRGEQLADGARRGREQALGEAEPEQVEVVVERAEVGDGAQRVEPLAAAALLCPAEHRVEDRVEDRLSGEHEQAGRRPVVVGGGGRVSSGGGGGGPSHVVGGEAQVALEAGHHAAEAGAARQSRHVAHHARRVHQPEVEHVAVHLPLDRVEVEAALLVHRLGAVRVHHDRDVLVGEAQRVDVAVLRARAVQEVDGVHMKLGGVTQQQAGALDKWGLVRPPGETTTGISDGDDSDDYRHSSSATRIAEDRKKRFANLATPVYLRALELRTFARRRVHDNFDGC